MTRHIVTHHRHHPDEGVYRLIYECEEDLEATVINPNYGEDEDGNPWLDENGDPEPLTLTLTQAVRTGSPGDIIWHDADERWEGMTDEQIAQEQINDVREAMERRAALERPSTETRHLGSEGSQI